MTSLLCLSPRLSLSHPAPSLPQPGRLARARARSLRRSPLDSESPRGSESAAIRLSRRHIPAEIKLVELQIHTIQSQTVTA
jgi:hypothetical protein